MNHLHIIKGKPQNEEGEMGVGALIIFIALILVAAVAASVILSTAYVLQQQAQQTGDQAITEVSTGFRIYDIFGNRINSSNSAIQLMFIKVGLIAGSGGINIMDTIIEIDDGYIEANLVLGTTANATHFNATYIRDKSPVNTPGEYFVTQGDLVMLQLNATDIGLNLLPQTFVTMKIIPKHGIPSYETMMTPSVYTNVIMSLI
ncbi:MAG TPA: flagellin [Euryarchaeota archaeon]|nr:flagellin [Euryarchaeota archaeon]